MQRFEITAEEIEQLVACFYARIREHDVLGPIFIKAVGAGDAAWRHHEAKIASFWRNAIGMDNSYSGTPMQVHMDNHDIQPEHFAEWLEVFHDVAGQTLTSDQAQHIGELANRIGRGLSLGIANGRLKKGDAPIFD